MKYRYTILFASVLIGLAHAAPNSQLPQLVNADGSWTSNGQSFLSNVAQGAQNAFDSVGQHLSQGAESVANGAQNAYAHGQQYFQQGSQGIRDIAGNVGSTLEQAGNEVLEGPRNFLSNVGQMGNQFQTSIENAMKTGAQKLGELKNGVAEQFRPLVSKAEEIFGKAGTEKEHWDELVGQVESTQLSEPEKQELYQKIANATIPQVQPQQQGFQQLRLNRK